MKSRWFWVKSSTRSVADMMSSLRGRCLCGRQSGDSGSARRQCIWSYAPLSSVVTYNQPAKAFLRLPLGEMKPSHGESFCLGSAGDTG